MIPYKFKLLVTRSLDLVVVGSSLPKPPYTPQTLFQKEFTWFFGKGRDGHNISLCSYVVPKFFKPPKNNNEIKPPVSNL